MGNYNIAVVPGDDAGPEAMESALKVLDKAVKNSSFKLDLNYADIGFKRFETTGDTLQYERITYGGVSQSTADKIKGSQAMLYTAVAAAQFPRHLHTPWKFLGSYFNTDINLRPGKSYPNTGAISPNIDMVIVRDQREGMFRATEFFIGEDTACSLIICSKPVVRRIAHVAFQLARARNKPHKKVSVINKAQVSKIYFGTWLDTACEVAKEYPDVECEDMHTDYLPYAMIKEPETLDVILCTNLLGDLYSDAMLGVIGSIGLGAGALLGDNYGIFKPNHGTAPDIAGKNIINPIATILAGKMMLDWLAQHYQDDNCKKVADIIELAIEKVLTEKKVLTRDLGGDATTSRFTEEVLSKI